MQRLIIMLTKGSTLSIPVLSLLCTKNIYYNCKDAKIINTLEVHITWMSKIVTYIAVKWDWDQEKESGDIGNLSKLCFKSHAHHIGYVPSI